METDGNKTEHIETSHQLDETRKTSKFERNGTGRDGYGTAWERDVNGAGAERDGNGTGTGRERDGNGTGTGRERDGNGAGRGLNGTERERDGMERC